MPSLSELQSALQRAITADEVVSLPLVGGHCPAKRLAIHRRHYQASLVETLLRRFPAAQWLLGSQAVIAAAQSYVYLRPPRTACLAEYGGDFPEFLAEQLAGGRPPALRSFLALEWVLGEVALCVDHPPCQMQQLAGVDPAALFEVIIELQPGLRYFRAGWPVDELIALFLGGHAPSRYVMERGDIHVQIRGARGELRIDRLDLGTWVFRRQLAQGQTAGMAAECALDAKASFDPTRALSELVREGLMYGFKLPTRGPAR